MVKNVSDVNLLVPDRTN